MLTKLAFRPGIKKSTTDYAAEGAWIDMDKARFVDGYPQKIGGWEKLLDSQLSGVCRGMLPWRDNDENRRIALGTHTKLYYYYAGSFTDITPISSSGTLTNPFSVTSVSPTVVVSDSTHGRQVGDYCNFSNASAVGGITIDGAYVVASVVDANTYTITHSANATSTVSNGGGSVDFTYEIAIGLSDTVEAFGYGVGTYGSGTYGTPRTASVTLHARTWQFDTWGENLIALHRNGDLYQWAPDTAGLAATLSNAPTGVNAVFVTEERHVVALGNGSDKMEVKNSDNDDNTVWAAAITNQANSNKLSGGNELLWGRALRGGVSIILSDTDAFAMQYTGDDFVHAYRKLGAGNGLKGPNAAAVYDGRAYWMSSNKFMMFDGFVKMIPNMIDVRDYVFDDFNEVQSDKVVCGINENYQEVWFLYPSSGSDEVDRYVIVSLNDFSWSIGTLDRTSWSAAKIFGFPVAVDASGYLYKHEFGVDADGAAMNSYAETAPLDIGDGDVSMDIFGIIPDFDNLAGTVSLYLMTKDKPSEAATSNGPYAITTATTREDTRADGRQVGVKMVSNEVSGNWRLGAVRIDVKPAGGRP